MVAIKNDLDKYLQKRKDSFLSNQRGKLLNTSTSRNFYKNIKSFRSAERPKSFDIRELKPEMSNVELANDVAGFFNRISNEFEPLDPFDIPRTYERDLPLLSAAQVEKCLKTCKKPVSMVDGDIFPKLVNNCAGALSIPLSNIFNTITSTSVWPISWKKEIVTVIPKKNMPESYSDLRNISCTKLFSKVYEGYVLEWAMEEIFG